MRIKHLAWAGLLPVMLISCVSSKKFKSLQSKYDSLGRSYSALQNDLKNCNGKTTTLTQEKTNCDAQVDALNKQIAFLKDNNTQALRQLEDMSVISGSQAQSIKKSLENIGAKDAYIQNLQAAMAHKDSLNMALMMNLKGAVGEMNDQDINIKVDKGVVLIDISDKLLFKSGDYAVTTKAKEELGKLDKVLENPQHIESALAVNTVN